MKHISAKPKSENPYDKKLQRERALWPGLWKESAAEKYFDKLLDSSSAEYKKRGHGIDKKDFDNVCAMLDEYWRLQDDINDDNVDGQTQISLINQQNDIRDELERIYEKYLPNEKESKSRNDNSAGSTLKP